MIQNQTGTIEKQLQQIADMLVLNGTLTECPGLVHGKMGISIFFFHYAKFTANELFADYAMDVIGKMLDQIHTNSSADYEKGVAGIGVGFNYLIRNSFLLADDDIFEDFDAIMRRAVMCEQCSDFSLYGGLTGYGRYWISRLCYRVPEVWARESLSYITDQIENKFNTITLEEKTDVIYFLSDLQQISGFEKRSSELIEQLLMIWGAQTSNKTKLCEKQISNLDMEKAPTDMGLLNGYAGEGMLRLTALDETNMSWVNLL